MTVHDVTFQREEYKSALARWSLVEDCCAGQEAVKAKKTAYLPKPNPLDESAEATARYKDYLFRAVFYAATGRTLQGMTGMVFRKDPQLELPAALEYIQTDVDGAGVSIYQQSQMTLKGVLKAGRQFLLVDYPQTGGAASVADMRSNGIRASIVAYPATAVVNWRTSKVGGEHRLSLVVIYECAEEVTPDGFGIEKIEQYRVLRLDGMVYTVEIWRQTTDRSWVVVEGPYAPTDSSGRPWDVIPGTFVGAQNNDTTVDDAPLYPLAELNIAHYRNSAEYEDTTFMCGQVQPVASGIDEHWVGLLQEKGIKIGSRTLFPLPVNATFEFVQAQPNPLPLDAMRHKEEQMVSLGAQLITPDGRVKTATEDAADNSESTSVLALCAANVSEAYTKCLQWVGRFMGATGEAAYTLSQDFVDYKLDAQMLTALATFWQTGQLPQGDLFALLRKYGLVASDKDDETIREELSTQEVGLALDSGVDDGSGAATD